MMLRKYAREGWGRRISFFTSLLGATVGLGDVSRFPAIAVKSQGGAFVILYFITVLFVVVPGMTLELYLGQFTGTGPATCWQFCPIFGGVGISCLLLAAFSNIVYQVQVAWSLLYVLKSVVVPWEKCQREWASDYCIDFINVSTPEDCFSNGWVVSKDGGCYNSSVSPMRIQALWNAPRAAQNGIKQLLPTLEYLRSNGLGISETDTGSLKLGQINWELFSCIVVIWILVVLCLGWGLKGLAQFLLFSLTYSFICLVIAFIYLFTKDGAIDGLKYLFSFDLQDLTEIRNWKETVTHAFYTCTLNTGVLICLSSFNSFRTDCFMYAFFTASANMLVSILAACVSFAILGSVAKKLNIPINEVENGGDTFAFVVYPYAFTGTHGGALLSFLFFSMIFMLGMSTSVLMLHTIVTALLDAYPLLRQYKLIMLTVLGTCNLLFEIPFITDGASYIIKLFEDGVYSFDIFLISLCQCVSLSWVYGIWNFLQDISFMTGYKVFLCLRWKYLKYWLASSWSVVTPVFAISFACMFLKSRISKATSLEGAIQMMISCFIVLPIPLFALSSILLRKGTFLNRWRCVISPSHSWGPALPKERNVWLSVFRGREGRNTQFIENLPFHMTISVVSEANSAAKDQSETVLPETSVNAQGIDKKPPATTDMMVQIEAVPAARKSPADPSETALPQTSVNAQGIDKPPATTDMMVQIEAVPAATKSPADPSETVLPQTSVNAQGIDKKPPATTDMMVQIEAVPAARKSPADPSETVLPQTSVSDTQSNIIMDTLVLQQETQSPRNENRTDGEVSLTTNLLEKLSSYVSLHRSASEPGTCDTGAKGSTDITDNKTD